MANNTQRLCKRKGLGEKNLEEGKWKRIKVQNGGTVENGIKHNPGERTDVSIFTLNSNSNHSAITHEQLHELINYAVSGEARISPPSWCQIHGQNQTKGVTVIVLHGVSQMHFYRYYLQFKQLRKRFKWRFSMPPPPQDFLHRIFGIENSPPCKCKGSMANGSPVVNGHFLMAENESCGSSDLDNHPIIIKYGRKRRGLTHYLLSKEELIQNDYPVAGIPGSEEFVQSGCTTDVTDSSPLFGLDCEMCLTRKGRELTRISVVNTEGHCLMDELVKPDNQIFNYLTRFSGITWKMLVPVKTKLKDVQAMLRKILPHDAVLVGHSLNNDLKALQMIHPNVIDTSLLFVRDLGRKFKLKDLVKNILGREIQSNGMGGHDPSEDAGGALELAQYFINQGPVKIAELSLENFQAKQPVGDDITPQPEARSQGKMSSNKLSTSCRRIDKFQDRASLYCGNLLKQMCIADLKAVLLGTKKAIKLMTHQEAWHKIECETDKEVIQQAQTNIPAAALSLIHFTSYADYIECDRHMKDNVGRLHEKMKQKLSEMCTVYAGPFYKDFCLKSVKRTFRNCGSISSFSVTTETYQPYVRIQYEVPESALIAVETLNGSIVAGFLIKVQRPVSEKSLDCDTILKKLEKDITNQAVIYVAGIQQSLSMEDLTEKFSKFGHIEAVISVDDKSDTKKKDCFIKYGNSESALKAQAAMNGTEMKKSHLNVQRALTPCHLQTWAAQGSYTAVSPRISDTLPLSSQSSERRKEKLSQCEQEVKNVMRTLDRRVGRLFRGIPSDTLCIVLLPGVNSDHCSVPGLCLLQIKENS
ncbi:RNA exonuclease 5-like [Pristis pectinata]|uniref:RNA exonuclease 5-like n=1 Tax=Pristis pectinata TaxID=685728 RepID=UPI00223D331A|nr:RNA exonuclease 5-like [Pristis pectinata]